MGQEQNIPPEVAAELEKILEQTAHEIVESARAAGANFDDPVTLVTLAEAHKRASATFEALAIEAEERAQ